MNIKEIYLHFFCIPVIIKKTELLTEQACSMENCQVDIKSAKK
jgi:uncharacterized membrane protein YGL010W